MHNPAKQFSQYCKANFDLTTQSEYGYEGWHDHYNDSEHEMVQISRSPTGRLGIICYLLDFLLQGIELRCAIEFTATEAAGITATFKIACQVTQIGKQ